MSVLLYLILNHFSDLFAILLPCFFLCRALQCFSPYVVMCSTVLRPNCIPRALCVHLHYGPGV